MIIICQQGGSIDLFLVAEFVMPRTVILNASLYHTRYLDLSLIPNMFTSVRPPTNRPEKE